MTDDDISKVHAKHFMGVPAAAPTIAFARECIERASEYDRYGYKYSDDELTRLRALGATPLELNMLPRDMLDSIYLRHNSDKPT